MNRDDLNARHAAILARHWRDLVDSGGRPGAGLLRDLAAAAEDHARDALADATIAVNTGRTVPLDDETGDGYQPEHAKAAPKPRTTRRRT